MIELTHSFPDPCLATVIVVQMVLTYMRPLLSYFPIICRRKTHCIVVSVKVLHFCGKTKVLWDLDGDLMKPRSRLLGRTFPHAFPCDK